MGGVSMGQHLCAAPGCSMTITKHRLMCAYHWFKVPPLLRDEVTTRYNVYRVHPGPYAWQQYTAARERAIDEVTP